MSEPNARFITRAWLGANQVELKSHWVLLQADTPGTCRLIVKQKAARLTPVALDLGWGEMVDRVFLGYVDRVQPELGGWFTLFCRELSAILANNLSVMLRHPTMRQVLDEISSQTGLEFVVPDTAYTQTALPGFYADTSGFAMLDQLGHCYRVPDFVWFQQGNGKIYVGGYADSFWHGKIVDIPKKFLEQQKAGASASMMATPKLRPNASITIDGASHRLRELEIMGTKQTLRW
ncbi:hypothetical protein [Shewanella algae]|uniref:hypothetical protein n=1 Tax=Shewanella algae TaxID=38313 RepID=UPI0031F529F1